MDKDEAIAQLQEWLNVDPTGSSIATLQLMTAILYSMDGGAKGANISEAIKCIHAGATMEHMAMTVQLYIRLDRIDFASKQVAKMKSIDEDCALSMMATAWVHLSTIPSTKAQEAGYIYEELGDKYGSSSLLLNAQAVSKMHQQMFSEAEQLLMDALSKSANDPETLANLIVVGQHLQRDAEVAKRYMNQLKKVAPSHQLITQLGVFEGAYDRVGATLQV